MKVIRPLCALGFIAYLLLLIFVTFIDHRYGRGIIYRSINVVPFRTITRYITKWQHYDMDIIVTNIAGNIAAFVPMGFFPPLLFRRLDRFLKVLAVVFSATLAVEVLQFVTGMGAADIDDIILNVLGGITGYLAYLLLMKIGRLVSPDSH